jgi:hypothetical protein
MPITAVLSRTLHEALGDEAAADLVDWMQRVDTQRAELREINELNFARIESRFTEMQQVTDARFGEARHELRAEVSAVRMEMHDGFAGVRDEMRAGFSELKLAIANAEVKSERRSGETESKMERRFAELLKWSFLFWCGTFATVALAVRRR